MAASDSFQQAFELAKREFLDSLTNSNENLRREILSTTSVDQVYDATDKLQAEQSQRKSTQNLARIGPYLEALKHYTSAIEVFVQLNPGIMALVWGPIRLLLLWTSNVKEGFNAIVETTARIGDLLPQFGRVRKIVRDKERLQRILVLFYRDILDFYAVALNLFSKSRKPIFSFI